MTRISHAGHDHPNTTAARTACRKALKKAGQDALAAQAHDAGVDRRDLGNRVIDDEDGQRMNLPGHGVIRIGTVARIHFRGDVKPMNAMITGFGEKNNLLLVDVNTENGPRWAYLDQIIEVIKH